MTSVQLGSIVVVSLISALYLAEAQTCLRYRNRYTLKGRGIFKGQMVGQSQKDCFTKCARDLAKPPCRSAYYFEKRVRGGRRTPYCHHFTKDSAATGVATAKSPRSHWRAKLAEVRRPCAATKLQAKPGSFDAAQSDLADVTFPDNDPVRPRERRFAAWGAWSRCSASCGPGFQARTRACQANCDGDQPNTQRMTKNCDLRPCGSPPARPTGSAPAPRRKAPPASTLGRDAPPSGSAKKTSFPPATQGTGSSPSSQPQPTSVARQPGESAPWGAWAAWSACPKYGCGNIQMQRARKCMGYGGYGCQGDPQQRQPCQCEPTPTWSQWAPWGACSKTCGPGTQTRSRLCQSGACQGERTQSQPCEEGPCPAWEAWSAYGACSQTCGTGQRQRDRACSHGKLCDGQAMQRDACPNLPPCPQWADWAGWTECSATCGRSQKRRQRDCQYGTDCGGDTAQAQPCYSRPCPKLSPWSQWSRCSKTCGDGRKQRVRECRYGVEGQPGCEGELKEMGTCTMPPCPTWADWAPWTQCSVSCGRGTIKRQRDCQYGTDCTGGSGVAQDSCDAGPCAEWSQWQMWSDCSVSCGDGGIQTRERTCEGGLAGEDCRGDDFSERVCTKAQPCPQWAAWGGYGECSATCGTGSKQRSRGCQYGQSCPGGAGAARDESACNLPPCAQWSQWEAWGICTATCGGGVSERFRECANGIAGVDCMGDDLEAKDCGEQPCPQWNDWNAWTPCTATCGNGQQQRQRTCSYGQCPQGVAADAGECYAGPCPTPAPPTPPPRAPPKCEWTEWGSFGQCSVTCGTGQQTRSRLCSCYQGCPKTYGPGKVHNQPCQMGPCGGYGGQQFQQFYNKRNQG